MLRTPLILALAAVLGLAAPAWAQKTGPHGGLLSGKGSHQTELVVTATELTVYIIADGQTHETTGVTLRAVVQEGGKTSNLSFADDKGQRLVAKLPAPLPKGAIVVLSGKDDHGGSLTARHVIE